MKMVKVGMVDAPKASTAASNCIAAATTLAPTFNPRRPISGTGSSCWIFHWQHAGGCIQIGDMFKYYSNVKSIPEKHLFFFSRWLETTHHIHIDG